MFILKIIEWYHRNFLADSDKISLELRVKEKLLRYPEEDVF